MNQTHLEQRRVPIYPYASIKRDQASLMAYDRLERVRVLGNSFTIVSSHQSWLWPRTLVLHHKAFEYICQTASQISLAVDKNMHVLLISGSIEFHNRDMIMESASSHASNLGSPFFGPVLRRWLSFPFSLQIGSNKLRPLQIILLIQPVCRLNILHVTGCLMRDDFLWLCNAIRCCGLRHWIGLKKRVNSEKTYDEGL